MRWIIIDKDGNRRYAKPNEIRTKPPFDTSDVSLEDGDLVPIGTMPKKESNLKREVHRHERRKKSSKA